MAKLKISKIKVSIFFLIFWLLASCTSTPVLNSEKKENYNQINFIYSANTNGELEPCGCRSNPLGGVQRRMNWQKSFENKNSKSPYLIIDSGDLLFDTYPVPPALEDQKIIQAKAIIKAYNDLGIRFFTPGELDFAAGFGTFEEIIKLAKFKVISSNLYLANKPLASLYEIIELNHKKIGFLGLYDETLPLPEELHAEPFLESAKRTIAQLKAQNVEVIVALTHLGTENDEILASQYPEINYIFGSHTNQYLVEPKKIGKTLIFQPSLRSQHIGVFDNGKNYFASMSEEWNSPANHQNALDKLISNTKKEIEKINNSLFSNVSTYQEIPKYQTTNNCAKCHQPQFNFVQKTAHSKAYHALEKVHQESNLECLKCHSLGQLESGGYQTTSQLKNTKKQNFQNVQCEHCHGAGGDHPTLSVHNQIQKTPEINQCLVCHTNERAPAWYKNGVVDEIKFQENLKKLSCPKIVRQKK